MLYGRWRCFGFLYTTGNINFLFVNKAYTPPSFDATYLYEYSFIMLYNLLFTSLPVSALGGKLSVSLFFSFCDAFPPSFRPRHQRQGRHGISSTLHPRDPWTRVHADQVLVVHARWPVSVSRRILYTVPSLDGWTRYIMERPNY
jgi:hypothetical protein